MKLEELKRTLVEAKSEERNEEIWSHIKSPFIEDIPGIEDSQLVTFLCRSDEATKESEDLYLYSAITDPTFSEENRLKLISDTDILYLSMTLPSTLRTTYSFVKLDNETTLEIESNNDLSDSHYPVPVGEFKKNQMLISSLFEQHRVIIDPRNSKEIIYYIDPENPDQFFGMESILELSRAPKQDYIPTTEMLKTDHERLKKENRFISCELKFEDTILNNEAEYKNKSRKYWIYLPPEYEEGVKSYPFVLFLDGSDFLRTIPAPSILDHMTSEKSIPPVIAVFFDYSIERRQQEYYCDKKFTQFIAQDLMKILKEKHQLGITNDPSLTSIIGLSASGLAAFYVGIMHPDIFGNAVTFSASFESIKMHDLKEVIQANLSKLQNSKFIIEAGAYEKTPIELLFPDKSKQNLSILQANKNVAEYLAEKSLNVNFHEFMGGHNYVCWRGDLSNRLINIFENRPALSIKNK